MAYIDYALAMEEFDIVFEECFGCKDFKRNHKHNGIIEYGYTNDMGDSYDYVDVYIETFNYMLKNGMLSCLIRFVEAVLVSSCGQECYVYDRDKVKNIMNKYSNQISIKITDKYINSLVNQDTVDICITKIKPLNICLDIF